MSEERRRRGRPGGYNPETAERILTALMDGEGLVTLCRRPDMPPLRTVYRWLAKHPELRSAYALARAVQAETLAEEVLEIAEGTGKPRGKVRNTLERARLRIEARKWYLGRLRPHSHGAATASAPVLFAPMTDSPSLSATERVQRLLALLSDARGMAARANAAAGEDAGDEDAGAEEAAAQDNGAAE